MRKTLLPLLALAGFAASGALASASAAPVPVIIAPIAHPTGATTADALVQPVYYQADWRAREWRRHQREEEWRRHQAWLRWHHGHDGYGRP